MSFLAAEARLCLFPLLIFGLEIVSLVQAENNEPAEQLIRCLIDHLRLNIDVQSQDVDSKELLLEDMKELKNEDAFPVVFGDVIAFVLDHIHKWCKDMEQMMAIACAHLGKRTQIDLVVSYLPRM